MENPDFSFTSEDVAMEVTVPSGTSKRTNKPRARPSTSKVQSLPKDDGSHSLKAVVEFVILLGLNSVVLWEKTLHNISRSVSELMNSEVNKLYFNLKKVCKAISTGVSLSEDDLSQLKLDYMITDEKDSSELLEYAASVLDANPLDRYSAESVKLMYGLIGKALDKLNNPKGLIGGVEGLNTEKDDDGENEIAEEDDEIFNLFGKGVGKKSKDIPVIKQFVSVRSGDVVRKCSSPGETGKILMKLEITHCEDLKGVSQARYWTKVQKKAVFLATDENDQSFRALHQVWAKQAKAIKQIKGADTQETEVSKDDEIPRKRSRF